MKDLSSKSIRSLVQRAGQLAQAEDRKIVGDTAQWKSCSASGDTFKLVKYMKAPQAENITTEKGIEINASTKSGKDHNRERH